MQTPASHPSDSWSVLKFGGTSVARRSYWDTIGKIVLQQIAHPGQRVLIVVSALSGVTNQLLAIAENHPSTPELIDSIVRKHRDFCVALDLDPDQTLGARLAALNALVSSAEAASRPYAWQAEVLSQGELLSSALGVAYLQARDVPIGWIDARNWLEQELQSFEQIDPHNWAQRLSITCSCQARPGWRERFAAQPQRILLTQGFIARHADGRTALLGRGGSDTSAAYFGALLGAHRVEIWTDVPGMFSANPKEVPEAHLLTRLDYDEAQEIAATGANVLHPRAIKPCQKANIPLFIRDTARPELAGTLIDAEATTTVGVKAISRRNGIVLVSMESVKMWHQVGYLADLFAIFRAMGLSVDMISAAQTNVTVSLDPADNQMHPAVLAQLTEKLSTVCQATIIRPCTAITFVGRGMRSLLNKLSPVWALFGQEQVHMLSQSSNSLNLTFVIDEVRAEGLVAKLHAELIRIQAMPTHEEQVFGPRWQQIFVPPSAAKDVKPWWLQQREALLAMMKEQQQPCYVYHRPTLRQQARRLQAVAAIDHYFYAVKANSHPAVLTTFAEEGFGFECVSINEIDHVFRVLPQFDPARIVFTPSFAPISEYTSAFALGVNVTLDSVEILTQWPGVFQGRSVWLRVDLGHGDGHHEKVVTGGQDAKFGLSIHQLDAFVAAAREADVTIVGIHAHLGSGIVSVQHWRRVLEKLQHCARDIPTIQTVDIGGGLPVPYHPEDAPFDLDAWSSSLIQAKAAFPQYQLALEPGRFLTAEAGVLLACVTQVIRKDGVSRVGVSAGMHTLLRPSLYGAWHSIVNLSQVDTDDMDLFDIVGPICESSDIFGKRRRLPRATAPGDILLIADAGAYGFVMSSTYNQRPLPRETILDY